MPLVIPFGVILIGLVLLGLALTVKVWANAMIRVFAAGHSGGIIRIITLPLTLISRVVTPGINYVTHELTKAASHYMHPLARWFTALADESFATALAVGLFAERTAIGFERLTTVVLPREIGRAVRPVERKAAKALGLAGLTAAALERFARGIDRLIHRDVLPQIHRLTHAIDTTIPRELGRVRSRVGQLERDLTHPSSTWLTRIAEAMWAATLNPAVRYLETEAWPAAPDMPLAPRDAALAAAKQVVASLDKADEAQQNGTNAERFSALVDIARTYPALGELMQLRRRGIIDEPELLTLLNRLGFTDANAARLAALQVELLAPADLAMMRQQA